MTGEGAAVMENRATDVVRSKPGWSEATDGSFPLRRELVDEIGDDEIRHTNFHGPASCTSHRGNRHS